MTKTIDLEAIALQGPCLEHEGHRDDSGYGVIHRYKRSVKAHREAWEREHGLIPDGLCVLHHCDNPPCVNVKHLFLGTIGDNNRDRARKGRSRGTFGVDRPSPAIAQRGGRHWQAKLSDVDVVAIRERHTNGELQSVLALEFGVNAATISRVARGVWR